MGIDRSSRLARWREKYGSVAIALCCLCSAIITWGNNWVLTGILVLGVLVCGAIGVFGMKQALKKKN
ncbi:hypothetical protein [Metabacillus litoralis]|uniref:hypothetical protein n=1 Tax=Metabacillus litoralis TaxID=152268 RepID=UPI001CFEB122|nr:hypothetical protein [Metabacillus litoralis]